MRLSSQSSQFAFNLPQSFLPAEIIETYSPILEKNWIQYNNVIDYLNSTIKSINFPGMSIDLPNRIEMRGKKRHLKPATNIQDITTTHELTVTFRSVDSDLNYMLLCDIFAKHYLDVENAFLHPLTVSCLDIHRDVIYVINFWEVIMKSISDNTFNYSFQKVTAKEFTITFHYNFYQIEFLLNQSKVLELGSVPTIIQKI